jgi:hypothetical protein
MHGYSKKEYAKRSKVDGINSTTFDFLLFAPHYRQPRQGCEGIACKLLRAARTVFLRSFLLEWRRFQVRRVPLVSPLNELARSKPSGVMSRNSTSAKNFGSTHVAFGILMGFVSFDFGLTTVSSCFLIWLETMRDHPVPTLPM